MLEGEPPRASVSERRGVSLCLHKLIFNLNVHLAAGIDTLSSSLSLPPTLSPHGTNPDLRHRSTGHAPTTRPPTHCCSDITIIDAYRGGLAGTRPQLLSHWGRARRHPSSPPRHRPLLPLLGRGAGSEVLDHGTQAAAAVQRVDGVVHLTHTHRQREARRGNEQVSARVMDITPRPHQLAT